MLNPQAMLDFARGLSIRGIEDLHLRLLSRKANAKKALIQHIDDLIDVSAEAQIVGMLRGAREIEAAPPEKPGLAKPRTALRRRTA